MPYKITIEADTAREVAEAASAIADAVDLQDDDIGPCDGCDDEPPCADYDDYATPTDYTESALRGAMHSTLKSATALLDLVDRIHPMLMPAPLVRVKSNMLVFVNQMDADEGPCSIESLALALEFRTGKLTDAMEALVAGAPNEIVQVANPA